MRIRAMTKQPKSLNQILLENEKQFADKVYLKQPRDGKWHEFTWQMVMRQAKQVAKMLQELGLKKGDRVAIFSKNCAEWFITDFGISLAGMVNVPLFANQHEDSISYVLEHAEIKLVFVGKLDDHQRVRGYIPDELLTVSFDYHENLSCSYRWDDVLKNSLPKILFQSLHPKIYILSFIPPVPQGNPKVLSTPMELLLIILNCFLRI